jgi:voltage-gated potassium channel
VHAVGQAARAMVLVQMVFNVVFLGTAVALLSTRIRAVATARAAQARTTERNGE